METKRARNRDTELQTDKKTEKYFMFATVFGAKKKPSKTTFRDEEKVYYES